MEQVKRIVWYFFCPIWLQYENNIADPWIYYWYIILGNLISCEEEPAGYDFEKQKKLILN